MWAKASASVNNGQCVEVGAFGGVVLVRDSKDPEGATLMFTRAEWMAFLEGVANGEFAVERLVQAEVLDRRTRV